MDDSGRMIEQHQVDASQPITTNALAAGQYTFVLDDGTTTQRKDVTLNKGGRVMLAHHSYRSHGHHGHYGHHSDDAGFLAMLFFVFVLIFMVAAGSHHGGHH